MSSRSGNVPNPSGSPFGAQTPSLGEFAAGPRKRRVGRRRGGRVGTRGAAGLWGGCAFLRPGPDFLGAAGWVMIPGQRSLPGAGIMQPDPAGSRRGGNSVKAPITIGEQPGTPALAPAEPRGPRAAENGAAPTPTPARRSPARRGSARGRTPTSLPGGIRDNPAAPQSLHPFPPPNPCLPRGPCARPGGFFCFPGASQVKPSEGRTGRGLKQINSAAGRGRADRAQNANSPNSISLTCKSRQGTRLKSH